MNYQEQLQTIEWRNKRLEILERDKYCCIKCKSKRTKFLRLSKKFGIKKYNTLIYNGCFFLEINQTEKKVTYLNGKNGFINEANFISENENIDLQNLSFALQTEEDDNKQLICFTENISEEDKFPDLNIHHKHYVIGKKAWEYENETLITLCERCHKKEHEANIIPVYSNEMNVLFNAEICEKCEGSGYLPEFDYYENGICFKCFGFGAQLNK